MMPAAASPLPTDRAALRRLARGRRPVGRTLLYAVAAQLALLVAAVYVVVMEPFAREEPAFEVRAAPLLPQRQLEHAAAVAELQQAASRPQLLERLATSALLPTGLPPLPAVPTGDTSPFDPAETLAGDAQALLAQSGLMGALGGLRSTASVAGFFGVQDSGERIVVIVNTSASVVRKARNRGVSIERIQQELVDLVRALEPGTQFGVVQFSQGVRTFADYLAPATQANKDEIARWVPQNLRGNPPLAPTQTFFGHEAAFEAAFSLRPDVVFLVTDGTLNRRTVASGRTTYPTIPYETFARSLRDFQRRAGIQPRVHVIGFEMGPAETQAMRRLARDFGGQIREF
jgi:hypothetical protein